LVVLGERASVEVEALGARVGDHDVGDGGAGVVDGQCDWDGLVGKRSDGQTRQGANNVHSQ